MSSDCHNFGINDGCKIECPALQNGTCDVYQENRPMLLAALADGEDVTEIMNLYEDTGICVEIFVFHATNYINTLDDWKEEDGSESEQDRSRSVINGLTMHLGRLFDPELIDAELWSSNGSQMIDKANGMKSDAYARLSIKKIRD